MPRTPPRGSPIRNLILGFWSCQVLILSWHTKLTRKTHLLVFIGTAPPGHSSFGFGPTVGIPCKRALLRSRTSVLWINLKARFLGFIEHRALYLAWARASFGHLGARGERPPRLDRSSAGPGTPRAGEHGAASSEAVPRGELRAARQSPTQPPPRPLLLFVACLAFWPSLSDRIPAVRHEGRS